ncbi:hypothetical protein MRX96_045585 [Rhipicephalus microplus]
MVTKEMRALLNLLQSMFFRNERLRLELAKTELLAVVNQETSSGAYQRPQRVHFREASPPAQVKLVAMTPEKLKKRAALSCYPTSEALKSAEAANPPVPTEIPKPMANVPPSSACTGGAAAPTAPGGRFFIRGTLVPLRSDETHELRPVGSKRLASARTLAKLVCSFLNTWKPCSVYYGISLDGYVRGVMLNREERKALRHGIDFIVGNLRPHLTSSSIGIEFVPVLRHAADKPEEVQHYVVEVWVRGVHHVLYTTVDRQCYLREGDKSYQVRSYHVRAWVVRFEEEHWLQARDRASLKEGESPAGGDAPPSLG